jgi:hypothetical protein
MAGARAGGKMRAKAKPRPSAVVIENAAVIEKQFERFQTHRAAGNRRCG